VVGEVATGVPPPSIPTVPLTSLPYLVLGAAGIVFLAVGESVGAGRAYAAQRDDFASRLQLWVDDPDFAALANPRKTTRGEAAAIAARTPAVAFFSHSIHGNEPAGFESAMMTAYTLLASESAQVKASSRWKLILRSSSMILTSGFCISCSALIRRPISSGR